MDQILLVVQGLIALALVGTILMQRSEGGALGIGGGPGGMMSARGAGNFLTKATTILAVLFLGMCIVLAIRSGMGRGSSFMEGFDPDADPISIEEPSNRPQIPVDDGPAPADTDLSSASEAPSTIAPDTLTSDTPLSMEEALDAIDAQSAAPTVPENQ